MAESHYRDNGGLDGVQKSIQREGKPARVGWPQIVLRVLVISLTLVAAILVGVDKQTKIVPLQLSPDLPAFHVAVSAKSSYLSAFVYFVVANSIVCALAAVSLVLQFINKSGGKGGPFLTIMVVDLLMVALLFSSIGATGAVGLIGFKGNSHLRWNKVCDVYGKFCHQVMAALALSLLAAVAYILVVIITLSKVLTSS